MTLGSPRLLGVREHLERAQLFFDLAKKENEVKTKYRLMVAATYSCRAITELMLEAAEKQEVKHLKETDPKVNRNALEDQIAPKIPYYSLIERIRIHDFHRFGLTPPNPKVKEIHFGGPMRLTAQKGAAALSVTSQGPQISTTGGSQVKLQRPLLVQDGEFFDEDSNQCVSLERILTAFLEKVPAVVAEFEGFMA